MSRRLNQTRRSNLVDMLAKTTRAAFTEGRIPTLLSYEAVHRNTIRSVLCLRGWTWVAADTAAQDVVRAVLLRLVAQRPSWNEGQPEWTVEGGTLIERTRCARCHKPLPEDRPKFCSDLCKSGHHMNLSRLREASEAQAATMARGCNL
jgi:hypothetical protein